MAPFFKSNEPSSKDDQLTDSSANNADDKGNTPTNTPSGGSQDHLTKGLKAVVAKGLEDQQTHPQKSMGEIVQDVVAVLDVPEGVTKDSQNPTGATGAAREGERVADDAGEFVAGSKQKDGQGWRKSSTGSRGGVKYGDHHEGIRVATETKEPQGGEPSNDGESLNAAYDGR